MVVHNNLSMRLNNKRHLLRHLNRGIERETLRVDHKGLLSTQLHPVALGSTLTHPYITTDFAEAMLEFVTPVCESVDELMSQLCHIHKFVVMNLDNELLWPASMPCYISNKDRIQIAQYGTSNSAKLKMLYREGLKNRYGALMQLISGIHYNFSLPEEFWKKNPEDIVSKDEISAGYLGMIRNYYRMGWVIPYLFGASPILCRTFLSDKEHHFNFQEMQPNKGIYLPYATSLRMSNLGYTSTEQEQLIIRFNDISEYIQDLQQATRQPSEKFKNIGLKADGVWQQINDNILQLENEYYAPIRPKRVVKENERPSDALQQRGIQYVEVRALDVNPYSETGISAEQVRFLDLFLLWCASVPSPYIENTVMQHLKQNWQKVILKGRQPDLMIWQDLEQQEYSLKELGLYLCDELYQIAELFDAEMGGTAYRDVCNVVRLQFNDPSLTLSARMLQDVQQTTGGLGDYLMNKASQYQQYWLDYPISTNVISDFMVMTKNSILQQKQLEAQPQPSFEDYLAYHNQRVQQDLS